ncbi:F-box/kelch-repeat protein SKIP11-like isoform X2 [Olea europaea var. sylvestris]|uniref:F-box kelch-repeat SKIP11-like n=2 Tax=Olea europaea subsp. europaea TaxID=158383 RepID=A0A8S0PLZ5_OLEEU|nr:F-box/kelch-repeat protein SKIP11-like isoform X2 [Olea europaea var. sylvestris]XP_022887744.1 F-box/kelch-repeat protein SKIP11-like isoform X2 [Olea europaea var. sylvestris]CAA2955284.1 F-box kelch-repeat SKIP11-like [Olea europaea subsp. europaea]
MVEDRVCLVSGDYSRTCEQESNWPCMNQRLEKIEVPRGKRPLETDGEKEVVVRKVSKKLGIFVDTSLSIGGFLMSASEKSGNKQYAGQNSDSDSSSLIATIGRDNSISCLIRSSRADYGAIASLNSSFRSLVRSGELYRLRRLNGVVEHWVYFSCHLLEWEAFDPSRRRWMHLPSMNPNGCFGCADKESLAVGTELLVFGWDLMSHITYRYSLLTNTWSSGPNMNEPRCLFGSASLGEIAILAGGCNSRGTILSSAELYNSELGIWKTLPSMKKPRKMCSGVFMDGKFYVIGGIGGTESKLLTCGEEYNLETETWTEIPNMSPVRTDVAREFDRPATSEAPPLIAVVNNELYAADYADMALRKYDKNNKVWITVGRLPERADSTNGWGLAFRACGDRLIVIGGPRTVGQGYIEVNAWVPIEGPPQWVLLGRKQSGSFVYNCAVMGC